MVELNNSYKAVSPQRALGAFSSPSHSTHSKTNLFEVFLFLFLFPYFLCRSLGPNNTHSLLHQNQSEIT
jgi:hypothetical protein